jgi:hypothetical protein
VQSSQIALRVAPLFFGRRVIECSIAKTSAAHDRFVQKNSLAAIVDQTHNSNKRPHLRGPTAKPTFGALLTLSDRFYTPTLIRPDNEWGWDHVSHKLTWV